MFPADTTASASPEPAARHGRDEARVGLRPDRLGRLVGHVDPLGRRHERKPLRVEGSGAVERHLDPVGDRIEGAENHLPRRVVAPECVDGDPRHSGEVYGWSRRSGSTSRPL